VAVNVAIFDMDDVLCRYDLGSRLRALSQISGKTPRDIRAAIWDSGFEEDADAGGYPDPETYLAEFGRRLGYPISLAQWIEARRSSMTPWPEVLALVRQFGQRCRLVLFSNNGPILKHHAAEIFPEMTEIFGERYCSYELATKKPDPASFRRLLDRIGCAPDRAWFVDDKRSNVEGARLAGLAAHHFRSRELLAAAGRDLGLIA
jgi:HAD superfamily hydrolase (TIGR01509 family)